MYPVNDLHAITFPLSFNMQYPNIIMSISNFGGEYYVASLVLQPTNTSFIPQTNANSYRSLYWVAIGY